MAIFWNRIGGWTGKRSTYTPPRGFQVVFLILTIILICKYDDGTCLKWGISKDGSNYRYCEIQGNSTMGIAHWSDRDGYPEINGQYFVVGSALIFSIVSTILCFVPMMRNCQHNCQHNKQPQGVDMEHGATGYLDQQSVCRGQSCSIQEKNRQRGVPAQSIMEKTVLLFGSIVLLLAGGLEAWLASGFGRLSNVITLYAIASATCLTASLLYMIDFMMGIAIEKTNMPA